MAEKFLAEYFRLSVEDGDIISNDRKAESDSISHQRELITRYIRDRQLYPSIQPLEFVYVPVISGAYASIAFTIPFYKVFDTDESHITDSMFPCRIENELAESIIRGKAHKKWIEAMQKIGVIKTYLRCYSQVLKVSVDEISCEILVGKLIDKATGQIVEFLEMMKLFFGCFDEINDCIASNSDPNEIIQAIDNVFTVMILLQQYVIEHDSE